MFLSTKTLTPVQQRQAHSLKLSIEEVSLLEIVLTGEVARDAWRQEYDAWVVTSQNAVRALAGRWPAVSKPLAVVGTKTRAALEAQGLSVYLEAPNARVLAQQIQNSDWQRFAFFCGNRRRDELPQALAAAGRQVDEYIVYHNQLRPRLLDLDAYQGVLFFSPSGVEALLGANRWPQGLAALAIGPTTAQAFEACTRQAAWVADTPSLESLLHLATRLPTLPSSL